MNNKEMQKLMPNKKLFEDLISELITTKAEIDDIKKVKNNIKNVDMSSDFGDRKEELNKKIEILSEKINLLSNRIGFLESNNVNSDIGDYAEKIIIKEFKGANNQRKEEILIELKRKYIEKYFDGNENILKSIIYDNFKSYLFERKDLKINVIAAICCSIIGLGILFYLWKNNQNDVFFLMHTLGVIAGIVLSTALFSEGSKGLNQEDIKELADFEKNRLNFNTDNREKYVNYLDKEIPDAIVLFMMGQKVENISKEDFETHEARNISNLELIKKINKNIKVMVE